MKNNEAIANDLESALSFVGKDFVSITVLKSPRESFVLTPQGRKIKIVQKIK